jgi:hypothetical protein
MGQLRLARYDEYFADSQKKLSVIDIHMRVFDKRLTDDIATVTANRDKLMSKITGFETDLTNFRTDMQEREMKILEVLDEIHTVKQSVKDDILDTLKDF